MKQHNSRQYGFTLLELLVSMMIFSMMSVMAYSGLINIFKSDEVLTEQEAKLKSLKRTMMFFERDMRQLVFRPRSAGYNQKQPAVISGLDIDGLIEFTRAGNSNPLGLTRSTLQRVRYVLEDKKLTRLSWSLIDHLDAKPVQMTLLNNVDAMTLRFVPQKGSWKDNWGSSEKSLPKAVELTLEHKYWGKIIRLFSID